MTTPAEVLSGALTNLANDRRRRVSQYANVAPRPGSGNVPRRLLSDIGFLEQVQFEYIVPHAAHLTPPDADEQRSINQIVLFSYGIALDRAAFAAPRANIGTSRGTGARGLAPFIDLPTVLVSAELDQVTYSAQKNNVVRRNMVQRTPGPAFHFLVDRKGNIVVGPGLDYATTVVPTRSASAIFVGLEGALGLLRADFDAGRTTNVFELPFTTLQLSTLTTLLVKLFTAYPTIPRTISSPSDTTSPALLYICRSLQGDIPVRNFSNGAWQSSTEGFNYNATDATPLSTAISAEGTYDLTTEVFRPVAAPVATANRSAAQTAIGTVDTAGGQALMLGAYASLAAPDRGNDIEAQTRRQIFVERVRIAHRDADESGTDAAHVAEGAPVLAGTGPTVSGADPHTYNYTTGLWGDGEVY